MQIYPLFEGFSLSANRNLDFYRVHFQGDILRWTVPIKTDSAKKHLLL